jgi:hypothetical protein
MTSSGIEPVTFQLVTHYATMCPSESNVTKSTLLALVPLLDLKEKKEFNTTEQKTPDFC